MAKPFPAKFPGKCDKCNGSIAKGDLIRWSRRHRGRIWHEACDDAAPPTPADPEPLPPPAPGPRKSMLPGPCERCGWWVDPLRDDYFNHAPECSLCPPGKVNTRDTRGVWLGKAPDEPCKRCGHPVDAAGVCANGHDRAAQNAKSHVCMECGSWVDPRRHDSWNHKPTCKHRSLDTNNTNISEAWIGEPHRKHCKGCGFPWPGGPEDREAHSPYCVPEWRDATDEQPTPEETTMPTDNPTTPHPVPAPTGDGLTQMLAAAIMPVIEARIEEKLGSDDVLKKVDAKLKELTAPVKIEMVDRKTEKVTVVDAAHKKLPQLIDYMQAGEKVYLYGPPGSGKSHAAHQAATALNLPFYYISVNPQSASWRLEGFIDANGKYVSVPFRQAYEHGGVFCIDEMDNGNGNLWTSLNSAIENGSAAFPDGLVPRSKDFILVATGNTSLRGADRFFPDRRPADPATIDRFRYLEWDYDLALERAVVTAINPDATPWMLWVQAVRDYAKQHTLKGLWATPRASISGAKMWQTARTRRQITELASSLVFKGLDPDTVKRVLTDVPLPEPEAA